MIGHVDDDGRSLLEINVTGKIGESQTPVTVWIDTAFDGHLVFPEGLIAELGLDSLAEAEAILADGSRVSLETYLCYVDWFGATLPIQVIANDGKYPLLGTALLDQRVLHIDYVQRQLNLD